MIKERPPCEGGLPPTQNCTLSEGVNGTGLCSSAVTASTHAIQPSANILNYSSGTNGRHEPEKTRTAAYCRMLVERWAAFDPALKEYDVRLFLVMLTLLQPDGLIIAGEPKLCRLTMKKSLRTPRQALERLCKAGYFACVRKGNGKGNASHYVRGEMFNPERSEELQTRIRELTQRGSKNTPFDGERVQFFGSKGGQKIHPQPIEQPINTHTEELPSALNEETWKAYCLELNPERDPADISRTLDKAIRKGARDGFWKHLCRDFNSYYKTPPKPQAPAAVIARKAFSPAKLPQVKSSCESPRIGGLAFDGLSKEEWHAKENKWYGLGSRENWIKAECPHLTLNPEKYRIVAELIAKHALQIA